jgi:two-component system, OmpR family, phosphate regulon sensor histidine kinase PhoR
MRKKRSRGQTIFIVVRGVVTALVAVGGSWSAVYWGVAALRGATAAARAAYPGSLLMLYGGIAVAVAIVTLFSQFFRDRRKDFFSILSDAMKRIAGGDFSVKVPEEHGQGMLAPVVSSLNEMTEKLRRIEEMRQEFISDVSHEIQSPLTSIAGFASALRDPGLAEKQRTRYVEIIESESRRLSRLSDNLLRLTSLESDAQPFHPERYRLDIQIRDAILSCEPQWSGKGIAMSAELPPCSAMADASMLDQVWINLVHNAVKFTPQGGTITVSMEDRDGSITVRVHDSGVGVRTEDLDHLFDRFYKADKSRTTRNGAGGSGLGLAIVRKIVSRHGGEIRAESEGVGCGTTFVVTLPAVGDGVPHQV